MLTANNFYRMTTATTIVNSGTGGNSLTKPAGTEVASIVPGKKYSVYIPTAATFTTNFNSDSSGYTVFFYAKPEMGNVVTLAGNTLVYDGDSFTMTNEVGDKLEIPTRSERARFIVITVSEMEIGVFIDGVWASIDANTMSTSGPLTVTLLSAGGIIDNVGALRGILPPRTIVDMTAEYLTEIPAPPETMKMFDEERDFVYREVIAQYIDVAPMELKEIPLLGDDAIAFKIEYSLIGDGQVAVNGEAAESGMVLSGDPDMLSIMSVGGCRLDNVVVTQYLSTNLGATSITNITTDLSSGTPAPTHAQDDSACNTGDTVVTIIDTANTIGGWFYATNGAVLPGVTMNNGVLSGTGLNVNGKPYAGAALRGWYFLVKTGAMTGSFTIEVPVHALTTSSETYSAARIDDLYESFFGNPATFAAEETFGIDDDDAFLISTEWNIVSSG